MLIYFTQRNGVTNSQCMQIYNKLQIHSFSATCSVWCRKGLETVPAALIWSPSLTITMQFRVTNSHRHVFGQWEEARRTHSAQAAGDRSYKCIKKCGFYNFFSCFGKYYGLCAFSTVIGLIRLDVGTSSCRKPQFETQSRN